MLPRSSSKECTSHVTTGTSPIAAERQEFSTFTGSCGIVYADETFDLGWALPSESSSIPFVAANHTNDDNEGVGRRSTQNCSPASYADKILIQSETPELLPSEATFHPVIVSNHDPQMMMSDTAVQVDEATADSSVLGERRVLFKGKINNDESHPSVDEECQISPDHKFHTISTVTTESPCIEKVHSSNDQKTCDESIRANFTSCQTQFPCWNDKPPVSHLDLDEIYMLDMEDANCTEARFSPSSTFVGTTFGDSSLNSELQPIHIPPEVFQSRSRQLLKPRGS